MTRAAFYVRVSTEKQDTSLQLNGLGQLSARRGWRVVEEYSDVLSGARRARPGLDRLLADAHAGRFDVVAVWKLDRLGRSVGHLIHVMDELLAKGIHVVSATEPHIDSTTPTGRLMRNIFSSVAEYERELTRERVLAGLRSARERGVKLGRRLRPLDHLREKIQRRRALGQGWKKIARALKVPSATLRARFGREEWAQAPKTAQTISGGHSSLLPTPQSLVLALPRRRGSARGIGASVNH